MIIAFLSTAWAGAYDVLKLRDGVDCAVLGTGVEVRDELIALAEGDVAPAYVPLRAASCLVSQFPADTVFVGRARAWVAEERWAGLGMVVAERSGEFAVADAVAIAEAAVAGGNTRVLRRFSKSERGEVRRVVDGVSGGR